MENILEKIILDNDRSSVRSGRLVSKQWLCAIAKLYRKMKRPLFIVNTNKDNSPLAEPRPRPFFEQHTLLYEFIKPMARHDRIEGFIPTFSLSLGASYFRKSNYTDFVNCLVQCGPSLVELYIRFPKNSAMSFLLPPTITLPNLNTFGVSFSAQALLGHHQFPVAYHHQHDYFPNNCSIHLVQTVLNASSNLRNLQFMNCPNPMNPPDMENLYLPDTLVSIHVDTPFRDFELLLRKNFPCLTEIRINATIALYSEETIYDLFMKLCPTLNTVWLTGSTGTRRSLPIRLPRMEHLTKFVMFKPWEFEERNPPTSFEETFPVLETLVFANQTEYSFSYLMSGMRSTTVTNFCVWLTSLRPHPPVMNFPPMGLPVGEDLPIRQLRMDQVHLQERRERMRLALQQMRLDIMQRHQRRMREVAAGGGDGDVVGVVHHLHVIGDERPPLPLPPPPPVRQGPPVFFRRPMIVERRYEERDGRNEPDADIMRGEGEERRVIPFPQWDGGDHDYHRYHVRRARVQVDFRTRRERLVNELMEAGREVRRGREPPVRIPEPLDGPPVAMIGRHPAADLLHIRNVEDALLRQPPRVVIRRFEGVRPPPLRPRLHNLIDRLSPEPQNPVPDQGNAEAVPAGPGPARPEARVRPEVQNPIRVVYQRMLDRMEVDREEEDNIIHRVLENERDSGGEEEEQVRVPVLAEPRNNRVEEGDSEDDDDESVGGDDSDGGGMGRRRRIQVAAVQPQPAGEIEEADSDADQVDPPEVRQAAADGQAEVNVAVREAFRIIRGDLDDDLVPPVPQQPQRLPLPPGQENGEDPPPPILHPVRPLVNGFDRDDEQPGPAPRPGDRMDAEIRERVRRRHRAQEGRQFRDLRQLRHRMIMDWANPRANRGNAANGEGGRGGPQVPLPERPVTMTKEKMQSINLAFPNLVKLTINISGPETCGLKYIFEEMRGLQSLRIIVENSLWTIKWDSLLTGIPQDFCDAVRSSTELWDEVYLNENHVSIRTMTST